MRTITIESILNGWICTVGCRRVAFISLAEMMRELERYLKDPKLVEKEYLETAINKDEDECVQPQMVETTVDPSQMGRERR